MELKRTSNGNNNKHGQWHWPVSGPFRVAIDGAQTAEEHAAEKNEEYKIARRIGRWTMITGIGTIGGVAVAGVAAYIFGQQLGAAQTQLTEQRAEFNLDRQPFVGIDEKEIIINKPLTFDADGARINFDLWFHTIPGNLPP